MPATHPYPVFLDLRGRPVLVVGGGAVALRKVKGLKASGARVTVVSPAFAAELGRMRGLDRVRAAYGRKHMTRQKWRLVFAATDVPAVNAAVRSHAEAAGIWCCRCDEPEGGDFGGGAMGRVEDVTVAISTVGASPALAARIRDQVTEAVDPALAALAGMLGAWRARVKAEVKDAVGRRALLRRLAGREMEASVRHKGKRQSERLFERWLAEAKRHPGQDGQSC